MCTRCVLKVQITCAKMQTFDLLARQQMMKTFKQLVHNDENLKKLSSKFPTGVKNKFHKDHKLLLRKWKNLDTGVLLLHRLTLKL